MRQRLADYAYSAGLSFLYNNAKYAGLQIRNGESSDAPMIGRYCGFAIPEPIQSSGSTLWMKFKTDASVAGQGFFLQYTTANTGGGAPIDPGSGTTNTGAYVLRPRPITLTASW